MYEVALPNLSSVAEEVQQFEQPPISDCEMQMLYSGEATLNNF
jgi:hypothetical protein